MSTVGHQRRVSLDSFFDSSCCKREEIQRRSLFQLHLKCWWSGICEAKRANLSVDISVLGRLTSTFCEYFFSGLKFCSQGSHTSAWCRLPPVIPGLRGHSSSGFLQKDISGSIWWWTGLFSTAITVNSQRLGKPVVLLNWKTFWYPRVWWFGLYYSISNNVHLPAKYMKSLRVKMYLFTRRILVQKVICYKCDLEKPTRESTCVTPSTCPARVPTSTGSVWCNVLLSQTCKRWRKRHRLTLGFVCVSQLKLTVSKPGISRHTLMSPSSPALYSICELSSASATVLKSSSWQSIWRPQNISSQSRATTLLEASKIEMSFLEDQVFSNNKGHTFNVLSFFSRSYT